LLGGVNVFGGRGKLTGVLYALVLIATLRNVLGLRQIGGDAQGTVIGLLLILSLLLSTTAQRVYGVVAGWLRSAGSGGAGPGDPPLSTSNARERRK